MDPKTAFVVAFDVVAFALPAESAKPRIYRMARAIRPKYWLSQLVTCEACSPTQADDSRKFANTLVGQSKKK